MLHFQSFTSKISSLDFTASQKSLTTTITTPMPFTAFSTTRSATERVQTQTITSEQNNGEDILRLHCRIQDFEDGGTKPCV